MIMQDKIKICHIVPSNYGGGVESAARSFMYYSSEKFIFVVKEVMKVIILLMAAFILLKPISSKSIMHSYLRINLLYINLVKNIV